MKSGDIMPRRLPRCHGSRSGPRCARHRRPSSTPTPGSSIEPRASHPRRRPGPCRLRRLGFRPRRDRLGARRAFLADCTRGIRLRPQRPPRTRADRHHRNRRFRPTARTGRPSLGSQRPPRAGRTAGTVSANAVPPPRCATGAAGLRVQVSLPPLRARRHGRTVRPAQRAGRAQPRAEAEGRCPGWKAQ